MGNQIVSLGSEGGSNDVVLHAYNECGLWIADTYRGSEIGGNANEVKTTISLIKEEGGTFSISSHGAEMVLTKAPDGVFTATLSKEIPAYEGE